MKKRSIYVFLSTSLAMLIPAPGRFVYGFVLVLELLFLMLIGTLSVSFAKKMKLDQLKTIITLVSVVSASIFFRQLLILIQPEVVMVLGIVIYLVPISYFFIGYVFANQDQPLAARLKLNMIHMTTFAIYALAFFLVRDLVGYGTFTFFGSGMRIVEKVIIPADRIGIASFIASIPGATVLSAVILFSHIIVRNKYSIIKNTEETK